MQERRTSNDSSRPAGRRRSGARWLVLLLGLGVTAAMMATATVIGAYYYVSPSLPPAETIREIPLQIPLRIFSRDGHLISEIGERRRILINLPAEQHEQQEHRHQGGRHGRSLCRRCKRCQLSVLEPRWSDTDGGARTDGHV